MTKKRYKQAVKQSLLKRWLLVLESPYVEGRARDALAALLKSNISGLVIREQDVARADGSTIKAAFDAVREFVHAHAGLVGAARTAGVVFTDDLNQELAVARRRTRATEPPATPTLATSTAVRLRALATSQGFGFEIDGSLEALAMVQTAGLLRAAGSQINRCECGRLFVRVGKRRSCSTQCQKRVYMRRFRKERRDGKTTRKR